jgi:hypothetical protein
MQVNAPRSSTELITPAAHDRALEQTVARDNAPSVFDASRCGRHSLHHSS